MECKFCKGEGIIVIHDVVGFGEFKKITCYACEGAGKTIKCKSCHGSGQKFAERNNKVRLCPCLNCMGNGYIPEVN